MEEADLGISCLWNLRQPRSPGSALARPPLHELSRKATGAGVLPAQRRPRSTRLRGALVTPDSSAGPSAVPGQAARGLRCRVGGWPQEGPGASAAFVPRALCSAPARLPEPAQQKQRRSGRPGCRLLPETRSGSCPWATGRGWGGRASVCPAMPLSVSVSTGKMLRAHTAWLQQASRTDCWPVTCVHTDGCDGPQEPAACPPCPLLSAEAVPAWLLGGTGVRRAPLFLAQGGLARPALGKRLGSAV